MTDISSRQLFCRVGTPCAQFTRLQLSDADVAALRNADSDDEQIGKILAQVALNPFSNYLNIALAVPVDFPAIKLRAAA